MKNLGKIINPYDIPTKEYVDPAILSYGQQYTEAELDKIFSLHKRVLIQLDYLELPVLTFEKSETASTYTFHCYYETETSDRIEYNFQSDAWSIYPFTLAPIDSPIFEGTPKAPTATAGTNTTQIATTAFVQNAISNTGIYWIQYNKTTFTEAEYNKIVSLENTETVIGIYDASPGIVEAWNLGTHQIYVTEDTPSNSGITLIFTTSIAKYTCFIRALNYSATWTKTLLPTKIYDKKQNGISIWTGTQEEYDALTTKDANTLYLVTVTPILDKILYDAGNEETAITGGWTLDGYSYSSGYTLTTGTKNASNMYFYCPSGSQSGTLLGTANMIDFTSYNKLYITCKTSGTTTNDIELFISSSKAVQTTDSTLLRKDISSSTETTIEVDISSVRTSGYLSIDTVNNTTRNGYVYKIWITE